MLHSYPREQNCASGYLTQTVRPPYRSARFFLIKSTTPTVMPFHQIWMTLIHSMMSGYRRHGMWHMYLKICKNSFIGAKRCCTPMSRPLGELSTADVPPTLESSSILTGIRHRQVSPGVSYIYMSMKVHSILPCGDSVSCPQIHLIHLLPILTSWRGCTHLPSK